MKINETMKDKIIKNLSEGVILIDKNKKITYCNEGTLNLTGFKSEDLINKNCYNILQAIDLKGKPLCDNNCPLKLLTPENSEIKQDVYINHKAGIRFAVSLKTIAVFNDENKLEGLIEIITDLSSQTASKKYDELKKLAFTEETTGLLNKKFLEFELNHFGKLAQNANKHFGVALVFIDNYFEIAGEHGFLNTEKIFKIITLTIKYNLDPKIVIGRLSDNIMLLIIPEENEELFNKQFEMLKLLVSNCEFPLKSSDTSFFNVNLNVKFSFFTEFLKEYHPEKLKNLLESSKKN
ncbi:MAG: PAS domain-containing protein [Candidatus Muiribacteriota bacterium]